MAEPSDPGWTRFFPPFGWLAAYRREWLPFDAVAGVTLAAYAIPVSLAYATLAGLQPQIGVYGYMLGGIGYALLGASRQLAIGPTSAISLMIAATVGALAGGDAVSMRRSRVLRRSLSRCCASSPGCSSSACSFASSATAFGWLQGRRGAHHHHEPAAEPVRRRRRRPQFLRPRVQVGRAARPS